jgi:Restriction endonuclease
VVGDISATDYWRSMNVVTDDEAFTWRDYEEHIYEKLSDWAGDDARVEFDQSIEGKFSGVPRQVDALISGRFANITEKDITAAVDCKYYTRNINVKKVDEFIGFLEDVQTDLGILITNQGFSPGAIRRASRGVELMVIVANIDRLPPTYHASWDDSYYESDYYEGGYGNVDGAVIRYSYIDPQALEYSFDPDNPPERLEELVLAESSEEMIWSDDDGRARCVRAVLRHRNGGAEPPAEDVKSVVLELAYHWEDGQPWTLYDGQLSALGL